MRFGARYFLLGLCLSLIGASPARERAFPEGRESPAGTSEAGPALVSEEGGRLSHQAAGRRFEFAEGRLAVSAEDSSWTYRFQGSRGGIRALSISSLPEQTATGSLEYRHREGIIERYLVKRRGIEQQFVLPGPYAGGDVLLTGSVETDLVPETTSSFEGIAFRRDDSTVLFYGEAKAVDAGGRTALLEERWSDGELTIVVPASYLAAARFPVVVDPFIGARVTVDGAVDLAQNVAVAAREGSTTFQALAVWSTDIASPQFIRGRIIGPRGITIVGPISVVNEFVSDYYTNPRVAWSSADAVWVVAANGSPNGPNLPFIQVNKVDTTGTKTTGTNLNAPGDMDHERDVDVACNNAGQCLIVWAWDSDGAGSPLTDGIKGVFYTPGTNTFGTLFDVIPGGPNAHSHPRVASNGTNYCVVFRHNTTDIDGFSVTSAGGVVSISVSQSGTVRRNPEISFNNQLDSYLVAWDTGPVVGTVRGSTLTGATPPVVSITDRELAVNASKPELASQEFMGWSLVLANSAGILPNLGLVRPSLDPVFANGLDAVGDVVSFDVAYLFRGLSIIVYEDDNNSATDHDIRAREFRAPAIEYADFDNDGNSSAFVWRPGSNAYFYYNNDTPSGSPPATSVQFGTNGDIPVRVDYQGDGIPDLGVFRPSTGYWYIDLDRNGTADVSIQFGTPGDIPVPGDYDGDGRTDLAVFRPSNGTWYIRFSAGGTTTSVQFGTSGDIPVPADYNGDLQTDIAVWRPSTGFWYVDTNLNSAINIQAQFGTSGDIPVPGDYGPTNASGAPDGQADFAVFRPSTGTWYVSRNRDGIVSLAVQFGANGDIPVGGVFDNDPFICSPFAVFRPSNGTWYIDRDNNGTVNISSQFGTAGDIPMQQPSGQYRN